MSWFLGDDDEPVRPRDLIRPVEVPVLTELKRRLARDDVTSALEFAYPKVVEDLQRAYRTEFPPGFSHQDIVERGFTPAMRPYQVFFDRLYALYAPIRYGGRAPPGSGDEVLELLQSLYSPEPMWALYVWNREKLPDRAPGDPLPGDLSGADAR
jgi:hypothetical protein